MKDMFYCGVNTVGIYLNVNLLICKDKINDLTNSVYYIADPLV